MNHLVVANNSCYLAQGEHEPLGCCSNLNYLWLAWQVLCLCFIYADTCIIFVINVIIMLEDLNTSVWKEMNVAKHPWVTQCSKYNF